MSNNMRAGKCPILLLRAHPGNCERFIFQQINIGCLKINAKVLFSNTYLTLTDFTFND